MTNLRDDTEIEIQEEEEAEEEDDGVVESLISEPQPNTEVPSVEAFTEPVPSEPEIIDVSPDSAAEEKLEPAIREEPPESGTGQGPTSSPTLALDNAPVVPVDMEIEAEVDSLFFVDTEPAPALADESPFYLDTAPSTSNTNNKPMYKSEKRAALGHASIAAMSDEDIVFAPKKYKQPQPIQVDMSQASGSRHSRNRPTAPVAAPAPSQPRAMTRAQKKAAKKDKKKGGGKKLQRARRQAEMADASDIEWGSDGPPRGGAMPVIEGLEDSDDDNHDDDVAILQDYLAGTLLNAQQSSDEEMDAEQAMDSDEVDEALQLDMMRRFGEGVSRWNQDGTGASGLASDEGSDDESALGEEVDDGDSDSDEMDVEGIDVEDDTGSDSDSDSDSDVKDRITLDVDAEADIDRQLALALENGEEDSDIEELFTGKSGWGDRDGDEADWFLQSMTVSAVRLPSE
jgi:hypothetical protein